MIPSDFRITFLGTEAASLNPRSSTSSYLVEIDRSCILVDAGIGVSRQLYKAGIRPTDINIILMTHWHFDHYAGLPGMLRSLKNSKLQSIFGPPIPLSIQLFLTLARYPLGQIFKPVRKDFFQSYGNFSIRAIPTSHTVESYGWAINEEPRANSPEGRKVVFSGDTLPADAVSIAARGADLLVHEATYLERDAGIAAFRHHCTAKQAAEIAVKAGAGALALTHIPKRYSRSDVQEEARRIFPQVLVPLPLDTICLAPVSGRHSREEPGWASLKVF